MSGQSRKTKDKIIPFDRDRLRRNRSDRDGFGEM